MNFDMFQEARPAPPVDRDHPLLRGLNEQQLEAVVHGDGPLLVLAGAGSGKTRVITHRIAWLIGERGVAPWQILAVTFSNKAAGEMRHRLEQLLGPRAGELWLGTFHAIGVRLLRQLGQHAGVDRSFTIYDRDDQLRMLTRVMRAIHVSDKVHPPRKIAAYIDRAKNRCLRAGDPALPEEDIHDRVSKRVYQAYEDEMRRASAVDFGDLLMLPVHILRDTPALATHWGERFRHVLVDEFQDTNEAQYALLRLLSGVHGNLAVVGDDDQSIYSWRGAEIRNILEFPNANDGAHVVRLERNYRSTDVILAASGAVVRHNRHRHDKTLWTEQTGGDKVVLHQAATDRDEADWVARQIERLVSRDINLSQVAVFYRTNAQSRALEEAMGRYRLPYVVIGGQRFYERAEIKDLLAYLRLLVNHDDTASFLRVVNTPPRGIGARTVEIIEEHAKAQSLSVPKAAIDLVVRGDAGRSRDKLAAFVQLCDRLRAESQGQAADVVGNLVLRESGLRDALLADGSEEAKARLENLGALLSAMAEHAQTADDPTLAGFLETVALVADIDALKANGRFASLMTMHAAKGLEYDVSFVTGLEANLIPHGNADVDEDEERRLLYVAMTRARKRMFLSWARLRMRFGREEISDPSPFLRHLPADQIEETQDGGPRVSRFGLGAWGATPATSRPSPPVGRATAARAFGGGRPAFAAGSVARAVPRIVARDDGSHVERIADEPRADEHVIEREVEGSIRVGQRVHHAQFAGGDVLEVSGYGPMARVTVRFARAGVKKVLARFLRVV